jgi:Uncharacterized conserved protein, contains FHA domain
MGIEQPKGTDINTPYIIRQSTGEKIYITKNHFVIGRIKKCDYQIEDDSISKEHCRIFEIGGVYHITDMNSTNSTFVDGEEVPPQSPTILNNGSEIMLSTEKFTFIDPSRKALPYTPKIKDTPTGEPDTNVLSVIGSPVSEPDTGSSEST